MTRLLVGTALLFAAFLPPCAKADGGFSDTSIGFRYGADFREPGVVSANGSAADIAKRIVNFTYVDGSTYGGNLLVVDGLLSDAADPNKDGTTGAREVYLIYRRTLHDQCLSPATPMALARCAIRTWSQCFDLNTKDTDYAPRKRMFVIGPAIRIRRTRRLLPRLDPCGEGIRSQRHRRRSGEFRYDLGGRIGMDDAVSYRRSLPTQFEGYLNFYGPKGDNDFGHQTKTETLLHPRVMLDIGSLAGHPQRFYAGVGYEYWYNKFGVDHALTAGAVQHTAMVEVAVHL